VNRDGSENGWCLDRLVMGRNGSCGWKSTEGEHAGFSTHGKKDSLNNEARLYIA